MCRHAEYSSLIDSSLVTAHPVARNRRPYPSFITLVASLAVQALGLTAPIDALSSVLLHRSLGGSTSPSTMKMFMCFLSVFMVVQTIGTVLFCLYLHMKMDKVSVGYDKIASAGLLTPFAFSMERAGHPKEEHGATCC